MITTDQPITFYLAPVINGTHREDLQKLTYRINVKWLSVSFDRLVSALTCPGFDLGGLSTDVAKSVLVAAADPSPSKNPCGVVGNKNVEFSAGEYNWKVETGSTLVYLAKKDGDPTPTNYDFKIEFGDGKPRVWVEDADKASCDAVVLPEESKYTSYNLHLIINGNDCKPSYGVAEKTELSRALKRRKNMVAFSAACAMATIVCGIGTLNLGAITTDLGIGCVVTPIVGSHLSSLKITESLSEIWSKHASELVLLGAAGAATTGTYLLKTGRLGSWVHDVRAKYILRRKTGDIKKILEMISKGSSAEDIAKNVKNIDDLLAIADYADAAAEVKKDSKYSEIATAIREAVKSAKSSNAKDKIKQAITDITGRIKKMRLKTSFKSLSKENPKEILRTEGIKSKASMLCGVAGVTAGSIAEAFAISADLSKTTTLSVYVTADQSIVADTEKGSKIIAENGGG